MTKYKIFALLVSENLAQDQTLTCKLFTSRGFPRNDLKTVRALSECIVYFVIPARRAVFLSLEIDVDMS